MYIKGDCRTQSAPFPVHGLPLPLNPLASLARHAIVVVRRPNPHSRSRRKGSHLTVGFCICVPGRRDSSVGLPTKGHNVSCCLVLCCVSDCCRSSVCRRAARARRCQKMGVFLWFGFARFWTEWLPWFVVFRLTKFHVVGFWGGQNPVE